MAPSDPVTDAERLARLKGTPDCVTYEKDITGRGKLQYRFSVHGLISTGEIFVEVTRNEATRVQSFLSRHKSCPPEARRDAMTLVDSADAYELARRMVRNWHRRIQPPFP